MNYCKYKWLDEQNKMIVCIACGHSRKTSVDDLTTITRICVTPKPRVEAPIPPPVITRIANFSKAAIAHATAGSPTCTQEEINDRFAICKECPLFIKNGEEAGICSHKSCGCNINLEMVYLNKIGWADQKCPIDKWGPIDKTEPKS